MTLLARLTIAPADDSQACCTSASLSLGSQADDMESWQTLPDTIKQEIGSPFCFLCENPKRLVVPQQMRGYPKLWQLPSKTANSLSAALKSPPDPMHFSWSKFGRLNLHSEQAKTKSVRSNAWYDQYGKAKNHTGRQK